MVKNEAICVEAGGQKIDLQGFVAESKVYYYETNNRQEAFYLSVILDAPIVDEMIKPMQSRGFYGPRDIHKKVWELPIPQFDPAKDEHRALSKLGETCIQKVGQLVSKGFKSKSIGYIRKLVKLELEKELREIDGLVRQILEMKKSLKNRKD